MPSSEKLCAVLFLHWGSDGGGADDCGHQGEKTLADLKEPFSSRFKLAG